MDIELKQLRTEDLRKVREIILQKGHLREGVEIHFSSLLIAEGDDDEAGMRAFERQRFVVVEELTGELTALVTEALLANPSICYRAPFIEAQQWRPYSLLPTKIN